MTKAWVAGQGGLSLQESPAPSPAEHEVVVAVIAAQVPPAQLAVARHGVPGWSAVGKVVAAGEQALALLDRHVLVGAIDPCGQCEVCRRGGGTVCPHAAQRGVATRGTLAARITVAARWVIPLDELGLAPSTEDSGGEPYARLAALAGDAALAYTAYARSDLAPKEPVVVVGVTPVTRYLVDVLIAKGITPVVALPRAVVEGELGAELGARGAIAVAAPVFDAPLEAVGEEALATTLEAVRAALATDAPATGGPRADGGRAARPWRILCTELAMVPVAAALAGPRATLTVVCDGTSAAPSVPVELWHREVSVCGVVAPSPELVLETAALAARGQLDIAAATQVIDAPVLARDTSAAGKQSMRSLVVRLAP